MAKVCNLASWFNMPDKGYQPPRRSPAKKPWRCARCTAVNNPWLAKCWGCGTTKGGSQS